MTSKLPCGAPGRRLLACALASTILTTSIGFSSLTTASERRTLATDNDRGAPQVSRTANTQRSRSSSSTTRTLTNRRTANTPRETQNQVTGNSEDSTTSNTLESLNWSAPMTRADGSKLYPGEIEGYRIYYKTPHQKKFRTIDINDASLTSFQLKRFKSGTYEFSVTTLDTNGLESQRSPVVSASL